MGGKNDGGGCVGKVPLPQLRPPGPGESAHYPVRWKVVPPAALVSVPLPSCPDQGSNGSMGWRPGNFLENGCPAWEWACGTWSPTWAAPTHPLPRICSFIRWQRVCGGRCVHRAVTTSLFAAGLSRSQTRVGSLSWQDPRDRSKLPRRVPHPAFLVAAYRGTGFWPLRWGN